MTATMYRLEMRRWDTEPLTGPVGSLGVYPTLDEAFTALSHVAIAQPTMFALVDGQFRLVIKAV